MRKGAHSRNRFTRLTWVTAILAAGIVTIIGSTGGGGGGDDDDGSVELLSTYDIRIDRAVDTSGSATDGIIVTLDEDGTAAVLRVDPHPVLGQYMCDQTTEVCVLSRINTGTFLYVFDESAAPIIGDLIIQIREQVIIGDSGGLTGIPIIGIIQVQSLPTPDGLGLGFISIQMASCPTGPGVNIYDNGVLLGCYTWDAFDDLEETSEDPAEQLAAFGYSAVQFLFEQVDLVVEVLGLIGEYETGLQQAGAITEMCDAFSGAGLAAPTNIPGRVVPDQGMRVLEWIDVSADGQVGPGDDFIGTLSECWIDDPTDDIDELLDGVGEFRGYVENEDPNREVLTAIGFTSFNPPAAGGVFYQDFTISETEETEPGVAEITDVVELQGGVSVLFTEPQ